MIITDDGLHIDDGFDRAQEKWRGWTHNKCLQCAATFLLVRRGVNVGLCRKDLVYNLRHGR